MLFHTKDVLSVFTGLLFPSEGPPIEPVYEILNYALQEDLYTHQLPRASKFVCPLIAKKHPLLNSDSFNTEISSLKSNIRLLQSQDKQEKVGPLMNRWLEEFAHPLLGEQMDIQPLDCSYNSMDPIEEAEFIFADTSKILTIGGTQNES